MILNHILNLKVYSQLRLRNHNNSHVKHQANQVIIGILLNDHRVSMEMALIGAAKFSFSTHQCVAMQPADVLEQTARVEHA